MLKFTSIALGLLAAISIVPSAQAAPFTDRNHSRVTTTIHRPVIVRNAKKYSRVESHNRRRVVVRNRYSEGRNRFARYRWDRNQDRYQSRYNHR